MAKYDNPKLKTLGYFPIARVADVLGKHRTTLLRLVRAGKVTGTRDGEGWYVSVPSLVAYLETQGTAFFVPALHALIAEGKREAEAGSTCI